MASFAPHSVIIRGDEFKFCCAHFVAYKNYRERLHGHNYTVEVEVTGPVSNDDGYVIDFGVLKRGIRAICKSWNEKLIIPMNSEVVHVRLTSSPPALERESMIQSEEPEALDAKISSCSMKSADRSSSEFVCAINTSPAYEAAPSSPTASGQVELRVHSSFFSFPRQDCALLPIKHSTAEEISRYFASVLTDTLKNDFAMRGIQQLTVRVFERPTQCASYTTCLPQEAMSPR